MSEWRKVKFLDLFALPLRNGLTKPSRVRGSGYKMINMGELFSNGRIYDIPMELVPLNDKEKEVAKVERYDLLFARQSLVLEGAGKCSIVMDVSDLTTFESHLIRVRLDYNIANPLFYYYYFSSSLSPIRSIVSQCAQAGIKGSDLVQIIVDFPPLHIQHRIATILSRYDSLIENYQKQIKLLEESAQRLYKEWFIDLRFPGHENTKIVDGVPEGWKKRCINDICVHISSGSTPSRRNKSYWENGHIKWVKTKELQDGWIFDTDEYITQDGYNNSSTKLFPPNTILMAIYASPTLGRLGILSTECCCNQAALGLIANENAISWQWLFWKLYELRDEFNAIARGAGQQNISGIVVKNKEIVIPTRKIINWFTSVVSSMFEQQKNLTTQIRHLTEARDRLLPKLMSGDIEI